VVSYAVTTSVGVPTGTVTVTDGVDGCNGILVDGIGACSVAFTTAGPRTLTATYSGDALFEGSSDTEPHTVQLPSQTLTVIGTGTGSGSVTASPAGISCTITDGTASGDCAQSYTQSTQVTLTATASTVGNHQFIGWSGTGITCPGTGPCTVTMDASKTVTAAFAEYFTLTVQGAGDGDGTVSGGGGIDCSISGGQTQGVCSQSFSEGVNVGLSASALTGSSFTGWSGACTGTGGCSVAMTAPRTVTASFVQLFPDLIISSGTPTVTPTSVPRGSTVQLSPWTILNQGNADAGGFSNGFYLSTDAVITSTDIYLDGNGNLGLAAGAESNWGGPTLTIPVDVTPGNYYIGILVDRGNTVAESNESNNYVATRLTVLDNQVPLTIAFDGRGSGTVSTQDASPAITCTSGDPPANCTASYSSGTQVTLLAEPTFTSEGIFRFEGWTGTGSGFTCTTDPVCVVTMDQSRTVTARFSTIGWITLSPSSRSFTQPVGGAATPSSATITLSNTGERPVQLSSTLPVIYTPNVTPWLNTSLNTLVIDTLSPGTLTLSIRANSLAAGTYNAEVLIRDEGLQYSWSAYVTLTVLPTGAPVLSNIDYVLRSVNDAQVCDIFAPNPPGSWFQVDFDYLDGDGDVSRFPGAVWVYYTFRPSGSGGSFDGETFSSWTGDGFTGSIRTDHCYLFGSASSVDVTITLEDEAGNVSDGITINIPKPGGANAPPADGAMTSVTPQGGPPREALRN
jgi:uncharacterized repeat protein (TIGR02543 family)